MRSVLAGSLVALLLGIGADNAGAQATGSAQEETKYPPSTAAGMTMMSTDAKKEMVLLDSSLSAAIADAKALSQLAEIQLTNKDKKVVADLHRDMDSRIDQALHHGRLLNSMMMPASAGTSTGGQEGAMERMPVAGSAKVSGEISMVLRNLEQAREASKKVKGVSMQELGSAVDNVSSFLSNALSAFRNAAQSANYTRLDEIELSKVPVKGMEEGQTESK
ncbi:MAG: hypothetical protein V2A73_12135 [Pseudomonadota bacterium]